ncbi:hypothetical protein F8388_002538 [Cannabis sativa]|uniref:Uncharacterized protein n=1 Tax=Cannabis sativa TaxID=3483 RepID=A0A7J6I3P1_CANSA|nr:hypothetical protein F8388_002538 [Cannabis sativa]KAF4401260.1 hypothetical protein G4B88_014101 [Cannabis sativa]
MGEQFVVPSETCFWPFLGPSAHQDLFPFHRSPKKDMNLSCVEMSKSRREFRGYHVMEDIDSFQILLNILVNHLNE